MCQGVCTLLNSAIDSDDGNTKLRAKALAALRSWLKRLQSVIEGKRRGEILRGVDSSELGTLIISTLEGSLMASRLPGEKMTRGIRRPVISWSISKLIFVQRNPKCGR